MFMFLPFPVLFLMGFFINLLLFLVLKKSLFPSLFINLGRFTKHFLYLASLPLATIFAVLGSCYFADYFVESYPCIVFLLVFWLLFIASFKLLATYSRHIVPDKFTSNHAIKSAVLCTLLTVIVYVYVLFDMNQVKSYVETIFEPILSFRKELIRTTPLFFDKFKREGYLMEVSYKLESWWVTFDIDEWD